MAPFTKGDQLKQPIESLELRCLLSVGTTQVVDSIGDVGQYNSVALNSATGKPSVAYYDVTNKDLKYASFDGTTWTAVTVDSAGDVGKYASLAIDKTGKPYIAYFDATNEDLKIASETNGTWTIKTVDSTGDQGLYSSLALTKAGLPRIAYFGDVGTMQGGLKFAAFDGSNWKITNIDITSGTVGNSVTEGGNDSLVLDSHDRGRISYQGALGDLDYASFNGSKWSTEIADTVDQLASTGFNSDLALDAAGHPYISYTRYLQTGAGQANLQAVKLGTTWTISSGGELNGEITSLDDNATSIVIDSKGESVEAYSGTGVAVSVKTTTAGGSNFVVDHLVDETVPFGSYPSMAIDGDTLYIAFYDAANGDLKFYTGAVNADGAVPTSFNGTYNDIAVAPDGTVDFAYQTGAGSDHRLHFATRSAAGVWSADQIVDNTKFAGQYVSITLDSAGNPLLAYYDPTSADLKYAHMSKGKWKIQTIDSKGAVGSYTSITLDASGNPAISYYDKTTADLRLATVVNGAWSIQTVDSAGDVGRSSQLALDPVSKRLVIAYEKTSTGEFRFAQQQNSGAWNIATVDTTKEGGGYISLAFDKLDQPAFTYYDAFDADLRFARLVNGTWQKSTVASKKTQGLYSQLFFSGSKNQAYIYYWNKSANEVDQATGDGTKWKLRVARAPKSGENINFAQNAVGQRFFVFGSHDLYDTLTVENLVL